MKRQEPLIHQTPNRERIETLHHDVIEIQVVFSQSLFAEVEKRRHLPTLVIPTDDEDCLREVDFDSVE
jgi:hypothetical protein